MRVTDGVWVWVWVWVGVGVRDMWSRAMSANSPPADMGSIAWLGAGFRGRV